MTFNSSANADAQFFTRLSDQNNFLIQKYAMLSVANHFCVRNLGAEIYALFLGPANSVYLGKNFSQFVLRALGGGNEHRQYKVKATVKTI